MKKILSFALALAMAAGLTACSSRDKSSSGASSGSNASGSPAGSASASGSGSGGEIYYLNFKPEIASVYDKIAADYQAETGVKLRVVTAASGTYEQTLKSEIAKSDAPNIFQINGPKGYVAWKDYCADLKDTELYNHLTDKSLAITSGDGVYGIPYVVEGYGIIYNNAIMENYFALPGKAVSIASADEIRSFEMLKKVVEDMTAHKEDLGIDGVFASTSLTPGEDWRWHTHLANIPLAYEFEANNIDLTGDATKSITFDYAENFQNIFDLYLNHSVTDKGLLGSKSVDDSMAEFALGKCAMVQNGNWAWGQISDVAGNTVKAEDIRFLPVYTGMEGEENQGLAIGTENFLAVNAKSSPEKQKLAEDFLYWLFSSDKGKQYVTNELHFITPFDTFTDEEQPTDPLAKEMLSWMNRDGIKSIPWNFTIFPSQAFKDDFGAALLEYAQGSRTWEDVKNTVVTRWGEEANA